MRIPNQRIVQLAVIIALGLFVSCGGGSESSSPPPPPPPPPPNAIQVTIQPAQVFQTWEAWRGVLSGPNFKDSAGVEKDLTPQVISGALDDLANDLGVTGVRNNLHRNQDLELTNDNADPHSINWAGFNFAQTFRPDPTGPLVDPVRRMKEMIIPLRNRVEARGDPFNMYMTLGYRKGDFPAHWLSDPEEYAELAEACILWLRNGSPSPPGFQVALTPTYWTIVNEPDLGTPTFSSADIAGYVAATGARFAGMAISTKIQTSETSTPNINFLNGVLNGPNVGQFVGLISYHGYDYDSLLMPASFSLRNQTRAAAQALSTAQGRTIGTAMTEICCHPGWGTGKYDVAIGRARDLYWNATEADVSVWENFGLMNPCNTVGCSGTGSQALLALDGDLSKTIKLPIYYVMRQYMRYIRPGYQRVGTSCSNCTSDAVVGLNVKPLAFRSPAGKFVVVVINDQATSQAISLLGLPAGTYDITGVDPTIAQTPMTFPTQTISAGQALTVPFPALAVVTVVQR
ncbi:MAG: hypothetical protein M1453_07815 [Acidobacteria bacterium]|nr:hypothetical protein [Acidobacteriota bacterium]MCL5287882.1 hypothetical protein [Acidobacteriota bacterium]